MAGGGHTTLGETVRNARISTTFAAAAALVACSPVVAPEKPFPQAIVLTTPVGFEDVLGRVNRVHVRVTRAGGTPRDTVLRPVVGNGTVRARAILRPDEGDPGTLVDIDLKEHATFLFRGSVAVGPKSGWPFEVRVPVIPVGTFDAGPDWFLAVGDEVDLSQSATIELDDGQRRRADHVAWLTSDSAVVTVEAGAAVARGAGQADVLGIWYGQVDTVVFNVQPFSAR